MHIVGGVPAVVRRLVLTEGAPVTLPNNCIVLHSEVVVNSDDEDVLEVWVAVPSVTYPDTSNVSTAGQHTIYTNTSVYEDDEADNFAAEIEQSVEEGLEEYGIYEEDWDD